MAALEAGRAGFSHLFPEVDTRQERFIARRRLECALRHNWVAILRFSAHGQRLVNPEKLSCPVCGREGPVVG